MKERKTVNVDLPEAPTHRLARFSCQRPASQIGRVDSRVAEGSGGGAARRQRMLSAGLGVAVAAIAWMSAVGTAVVASMLTPTAAFAAQNSCVACHSDDKWMVQNRKLYDYYQNWETSVHGQEGVTCTDCHGGNPRAADKGRAHAGSMNAGKSTSPVNFRNVPATCADCHSEILAGYKKSSHYRHLMKAKGKAPTCVTCHGSVDAAVVKASQVQEACARCHNAKTRNHPDVPARAQDILYQFLSIQRYYRYVSLRGDPLESREFLKKVDPLRAELGVLWHTFDLDKVAEKTPQLLSVLKKRRAELRKSKKSDK